MDNNSEINQKWWLSKLEKIFPTDPTTELRSANVSDYPVKHTADTEQACLSEFSFAPVDS